MNENLRNDIAAFRFGLIAQVVQRKLQPGERYALLREIAKQRYTIPGSEKATISIRSLERYLHGFGACHSSNNLVSQYCSTFAI